MGEWVTGYGDWPDWKDSGREVEIETDGEVVQGKLEINDFIHTGDGDECPIFTVTDKDGAEHSFASADRWRYTDKGAD